MITMMCCHYLYLSHRFLHDLEASGQACSHDVSYTYLLLPPVLSPIETVSTIEMHFNLSSELVVHTEDPLPTPAKFSTDSCTKTSTEQDFKLNLLPEDLGSSFLKLNPHLGQLHRMLLLVAEDCPTNPTHRSRRVRRCLCRVFALATGR
jgi:hypothetical protein